MESDGAVALDAIIRAGVRDKPDVSALASREENRISILLWHYHDADLPGPNAAVQLSLKALPERIRESQVTHYRIDEEHSNAFSAWKHMGSPQQPTPDQYTSLELAGQLAMLGAAELLRVTQREGRLSFSLPRQAVDLVLIEW